LIQRQARTTHEFFGLALPAALLLLAGCATVPDDRAADRPSAEARALIEISQALPGEYLSSRNRRQREADEAPLRISIETLPSDRLGQAGFMLSQRQGDGPTRHFLVAMDVEDQGRIGGAFAPVDENGQVRRRCDMRFSLHSNGFSGETDPQTCRFGADQSTGLLKEIAFDGTLLVIADRLIDLESGESLASDQVHRFVRIRPYAGWAGRLEGNNWRLVRQLDLATGEAREPADAANMSLGLHLELEAIELQEGEEIVLRLNVSDSETGAVLGQAWADPDAESLGLALPDIQIGLRLLR